MLIKFHEDFRKFTNGLKEVHIQGPTVESCIDRLFNKFPQLAVFLLEHEGSEAKKSSLLLNGTDYLWKPADCKISCSKDDVLELGRDVPTGSGAIGKIIAGIVLIVVGVIVTPLSGPIGAGLIGAGIGLVVGGVGELIIGTPKIPKPDGVTDSPSYSFNGIQNTTAEGTPVGIVYGEHKVGGHFLNVYTDVDGNDNYLFAQVGICEGEIESISDVKINDRPANYFSGAVEVQTRLGTKDQTIMPWFNRVENSVSYNLPAVATAGQTVGTDEVVDAVKVTVKCPSIMINDPKRGTVTNSVSYKIEYRAQDSLDPWSRYVFQELVDNIVVAVKDTFSFEGKSASAQYNEHLIEFPTSGAYEIKITRLTEDRTDTIKYVDDFYLESVNRLTYGEFAYPHTAMLGLKIKATNQISGGMPKITSKVKGMKIRVPSNYNPASRTYTGEWDGTLSEPVYSNNPAWCLYDFVVNNRYGIGRYVKLNKDQKGKMLAQLYLMGQYCDTPMPDGEPRFQLDLVIDSASSAAEWLSVMAGVMRASLFYMDGRLQLDIDRLKPMTHIFSMGNIVKGSYSQQGASYKDIPNVYEVQFYDEDKDYRSRVFRLEDTSIQRDISIEERKKTLNLKGCTRINQAKRLARFALLLGKHCTKTAVFKAGVESINCGIGDIVGVQHDTPQWGFGGRVVSVDTSSTSIVVSSEIPIEEGREYSVKIQQGSNTYVGPITNAPGLTYKLNLTLLPDWVKNGSVVVVGETTYEIKPFKILSMKRDLDETAEIVAVEYNDSIYSASEDLTGLTEVVEHNYSELEDPSNVSVSDVKLRERIYLAGDGTVRSGIDVTYSIPYSSSFWAGAVVYYAIVGFTNYEMAPVDMSGAVFLPSLEEQQEYDIVVGSVYKDGTRQSIAEAKAEGASSTVYLYGKLKPPEQVISFNCAQDPWNNNFLRFQWEPGRDAFNQIDPDLSHYELRKGTNWDTAEVIATLVKEKYYNEYFIQSSGTYTFLVKAVDTSGNYSSDPATVSITAKVEPSDVTGFRSSQMGDEVLLTWDLNRDKDILGYEIRRGVSWDTAAIVNPMVQGTFLRVSGIVQGTLRFWIKAIDKYFNYSVNATSSDINITGLSAQNIVVSFDEVTLGWNGNHAGTVNVGGALTLDTAFKWDDGQLWDSGLVWDELSLGDGVYESTVYDLGSVVNAKVLVEYLADLSEGNSVKIEIKTSDNGVDWSDYFSFYGGYVTARYVRYKITLSSVGGSLQVTTFKTHYDVPETTLKGTATVTDTANGITIPFNPPFVMAPTPGLTLIGTVGLPNVEAISNSSMTIKIYNLSGTSTTGTFSWNVTGY